MADETPLQVLKESWRKAQTKSYMWVFRSGEYDHTQPAVQGLVYIDKLFELERKIHARKGVTFDAIKAYRLDKGVPVLDGFFV